MEKRREHVEKLEIREREREREREKKEEKKRERGEGSVNNISFQGRGELDVERNAKGKK